MVSALKRFSSATFSALKIRNFRLYFIGQNISLVGSWMQLVAQSWLVLELTKSGWFVGVTTALQYLPVLVLAPYGGLLADRFSKRRLLLITQTVLMLLAGGLGTLVAFGAVKLWMVMCFAVVLGTVNALDNPTRQSFIHELAGPEEVKNAVTLNSLGVNLSRVIGPAIAGAIIARVGLAWCFGLNAVSFLFVIACLWLMRGSELHRSERVEAAKGQLAEGFRYVVDSPIILLVLVMMALVGTFTLEFQVTLPLLARFVFHGGADTYAMLYSAMGVGAVAGGLVIAGRKHAKIVGLGLASLAFGAAVLLLAASPSFAFALVCMAIVGVFQIAFTTEANTTLQLESAPEMRGRVMSLWSMAFLGSTLIGAPIVGWVAQYANPRWSLVVGGVAALIAGVICLAAVGLRRRQIALAEHPQIPYPAEKEEYV